MVSKPKKRQPGARKKVSLPSEPASLGPIAEFYERKTAEDREAKIKSRGGRPPVPDADRRDTLVRVLTTAAEHEVLQSAAAYVGMTLSTWVRFVALERARALATEIEAARDRDE